MSTFADRIADGAETPFDSLLFCVWRAAKEALPTVLNSRSNVFDDDEFDVFRRDRVDMTRVWKGRR